MNEALDQPANTVQERVIKGDPSGGAGQVLHYRHHVVTIGVQEGLRIRHHAHMARPEHQIAPCETAEILGQRHGFTVLFRPSLLRTGITRMNRPDTHTGIEYRMDASWPYLAYAPS